MENFHHMSLHGNHFQPPIKDNNMTREEYFELQKKYGLRDNDGKPSKTSFAPVKKEGCPCICHPSEAIEPYNNYPEDK